ncbi:MAG: phenylpropionate dioxygenase [Betaproteobacteria bacterium]|nr:phenylpropionate dioxygenase [Betaproteobacteria bacterium]
MADRPQDRDAIERACERFLYAEARLLDRHQYGNWLALLSPEIDYRIPVRRTVSKHDGDGFSDKAFFMEEDFGSLALRIKRFESDYAWSENPPTRTRRMVANVHLERIGSGGEAQVCSNLVVYCFRGDAPVPVVLSAERQDTLCMLDQGWQLKQRLVLLDTTVLGMESLSIFL